jgi:alpha-L-fucosidase 2
MIFGGATDTDRIQFNEQHVMDRRDHASYERKGAVNYLPQIRQLLFEGKQKLKPRPWPKKQFMGMKSHEATYAASIRLSG